MSTDVNIHLWFENIEQYEISELFGQVLDCIPIPKNLDKGRSYTRFLDLKICEIDSSEIIVNCRTDTNDVADILEYIKRFTEPHIHYEVNTVYDHLSYDKDTNDLKPSLRPLIINYDGPEFGWQGHNFKRYGPVRIDFSQKMAFSIPSLLTNRVEETVRKGGDATHDLWMIDQLSRNFDLVRGLAKRLILRTNPKHLIVCTDVEVHPLTSHLIYHRDLQDYCEDLRKIARLHEYGGVYFCEVMPDEPAYIEPRKSPPDYGYLRGPYVSNTEEEFVRMLQPYVDQILAAPDLPNLSNAQIRECFESLEVTVAEAFQDSYLLSVNEPPFSYIEEPYLKLYDLFLHQVGITNGRKRIRELYKLWRSKG